MKENKKSADTKVSNTPKTEGKVTDNQPRKQESRFVVLRYKDFFEYGAYYLGSCCSRAGENDTKVEQQVEAHLTQYVLRCMTGEEGDCLASDYLFKLTDKSLMIWNDHHYEQISLDVFSVILRQIFMAIGVGIVYYHRTTARIASAIPASLEYIGKVWEPQPGYITFKNGVLEVGSGKLMEPTPDIHTGNVIHRIFDPKADCPKFRKAVTDALDKDTAKVFQEACGNLFLGFQHEIITILVGDGLNGKSTICNAIAYALGGRDNVSELTLKQITDEQGQHRANMIGKIANICPDSGDLDVGNEDNLKRYCSGESMSFKRLYEQPGTISGLPKSLICTNTLSSTSDHSPGFLRRLLIIPFNKVIKDVNVNLKKELEAEADGILNWLLEGAKRLEKQGKFSHSETIAERKESYQIESNPVAMWLRERDYKPHPVEKVKLGNIYADFDKWRICNGYKQISNKKFAERLRFLGVDVRQYGAYTYAYLAVDDLPT